MAGLDGMNLIPLNIKLEDTEYQIKMKRHQLKNCVYMKMAIIASLLGTCRRLKVGCVLLTKEGRIAATGCNGAGAGMKHCHPEICGPGKRCLRCAHAEENAVDHAKEDAFKAYVTHEPCAACTRRLINKGVRHIFYVHSYNSMPSEEKDARDEWIDHYGVSFIQISEEEIKEILDSVE